MAIIRIDSQYDSRSGKFYVEVIPVVCNSVPPFHSAPAFDDRYEAERAGLRYLEVIGVATFDPHQVAQLQ